MDSCLVERLDENIDLYNSKLDYLQDDTPVEDHKNPICVIRFLTGCMQGKEFTLEKNLMVELLGKTKMVNSSATDTKNDFSVGSNVSSDVYVSDYTLQREHCMIRYDDRLGWILEDNNWEKNIYGTKVMLANYEQIKDKKASNQHRLFKGMAIGLEEGVLMGFWIQNCNEEYPDIDIYDSADEKKYFEKDSKDNTIKSSYIY